MRVQTLSWKPALFLAPALAALALAVVAPNVAVAETRQEEPPAESVGEAGAADPRVVVYYFHGERRCKTCRTIEAFAEETVRGRFANQLACGELAWRAVNYDLPENEHFLEEFGLASSSVVLVEMAEGEPVRFEVLQETWSLVRDKAAFERYVADAVRGYLG